MIRHGQRSQCSGNNLLTNQLHSCDWCHSGGGVQGTSEAGNCTGETTAENFTPRQPKQVGMMGLGSASI